MIISIRHFQEKGVKNLTDAFNRYTDADCRETEPCKTGGIDRYIDVQHSLPADKLVYPIITYCLLDP